MNISLVAVVTLDEHRVLLTKVTIEAYVVEGQLCGCGLHVMSDNIHNVNPFFIYPLLYSIYSPTNVVKTHMIFPQCLTILFYLTSHSLISTPTLIIACTSTSLLSTMERNIQLESMRI